MADPFFDTNIVIDWMFDRMPAKLEIASYPRHRISRVAWAEILVGEPPSSRTQVERLLTAFHVVEVDEAIARIAVEVRHRTRMKLLDALIYATAQAHGALLVTRDIKAFPADMPGVRVPYTL